MPIQSYLVEHLNPNVERVTVLGSAPANLNIVSYSNTTRPAATLFPAGFAIWNTDDNAYNTSNGTAWYDAMGGLT